MEAVYHEKRDCSGCGLCRSVCPVQAISMAQDSEGFRYPQIDQERCVDCGRCAAACPFLREGHYKMMVQPTFYLLHHRSKEVLRQSTSGGAFTAFSDGILQAGGVVYGAVFDEQLRVMHGRAETPEERDRMRISKYVQSDLGEVYASMKADLAAGREVLFTGTPCQTAGMRARFGQSPHADRLFLCDVICHSIPSPSVWEDYKHLLEDEAGGKMAEAQFRSKKYAWTRANSNKGFLYRIAGETEQREDDRFYQLFLGGWISRPSCSRCPFTDTRRSSDLTIADYFGIEKFAPEKYDPLGLSLVLVSTPQGKRLLERADGAAVFEQRSADEAVSQQGRLSAPGGEPPTRQKFWEIYTAEGLTAALQAMEQEK